jgi:hypothetical protein
MVTMRTVPKKLDYQKRAVDCAARAATSTTDEARAVWREMERYWRKRSLRDDVPLVPDDLPAREREKARY